MSKTARTTCKPVITLYEKIDTDMLERLISSEEIPEDICQALKDYRKKMRKGRIPVNYFFSKKTNEGRLYAERSLSLQCFKKEIRHALAGSRYYDIDMANAHPCLIMQYCQKNKIECPELTKYVNDRERILEKVMKAHNLNRDSAKVLLLRLCYLGNYVIENPKDGSSFVPDKKLRYLVCFLCEMRDIADKICILEKAVYDRQVKAEKTHLSSSTLSVVAQKIEHECLMAMHSYYTKQGYTVGVLCFDGMMVEINDKLTNNFEEILNSCETFVSNKTGYNIKLERKTMNVKLTVAIPEFSDFVESDCDAQEKLFKIVGENKFRFCNGILYIFDERTGMFSTRVAVLNHYLRSNKGYLNSRIDGKSSGNYGTSASLRRNVIPFVEEASLDDGWLDRTETSSLGYLLFKNGIYNMKSGTFKSGYDPNIVFHMNVPWDFPERNQQDVDYAMSLSFNRWFENPKPLIIAIACALAGDNCLKKIYFCPGRSNSGKSYLAKMLSIVFGKYFAEFNAESLVHITGDSRDEAAKMRWVLLARFARILMSNEISMKRDLDGSLIKKYSSGGDKLIGRTHNKEENRFTPHFTLFCMLNDIPPITPFDEAVMKRLVYIEFGRVFVDKCDVGKRPYYIENDPNIGAKIKEQSFINGFIHIFLDGYKEFLANGLPQFDEVVKEKWTVEGLQKDGMIELLRETYEITNNAKDKIPVTELRKFKTENKDQYQTLSLTLFNRLLEEDLGLVQTNVGGKRYWTGIVRKNID